MDAETTSHMNVLHAACEAQKVEVVRYVMDFLKDKEEMRLKMVNTKNSDGKLPFELAMGVKNQAICQILKDGGDPNAASGACIIM